MAWDNDGAADDLIRREAALRGISETLLRMLRACPTSLIQDVVADHVGKPSPLTPSSMATSSADRATSNRGNGWYDPKPLTAPPGIEHVDALCEAATERERRKAILDAAMENEFILRQQQRLRDRELDPFNTGIYKTKDQLDRGE
jgi:hypothetical protein